MSYEPSVYDDEDQTSEFAEEDVSPRSPVSDVAPPPFSRRESFPTLPGTTRERTNASVQTQRRTINNIRSLLPQQCTTCGERPTFMSKKHKICYDCLVHSLVQAKLFYQGFDVSRNMEEKMCIICLDPCKYIGDRYRICVDCLVKRMGDLGILKFRDSENLIPLYVALNTEASRDFECIDWQRKKYYDCDICQQNMIEGHRKERLCLDCVVDLLLDTNYFVRTPRRLYHL